MVRSAVGDTPTLRASSVVTKAMLIDRQVHEGGVRALPGTPKPYQDVTVLVVVVWRGASDASPAPGCHGWRSRPAPDDEHHRLHQRGLVVHAVGQHVEGIGAEPGLDEKHRALSWTGRGPPSTCCERA